MSDTELLQAMRDTLQMLRSEPHPLPALACLRPHLAWPAPAAQAHFSQAFGVFRAVAHGLMGARLSDPVHRAAEHPDEPEALWNLGLLLLQQGLPDIAATVLQRLEDTVPGRPHTVEALATALGDAGHHEAAVRAVLRHPPLLAEGVVFTWLVGYHSMMAGDVDGAHAVLPTLRATAQDRDETYLAAQLGDMVARYQALEAHGGVEETDLVGWHLVTTGGLLLHRAAEGTGRYGRLAETPELLLEGVKAVELLVKARELPLPSVMYVPDSASAVLGKALALALDLEAVPWRGQDDDGIVVADDLGTVGPELLAPLRTKQPGQLLWSHACCWHVPQPVAADLVTVCYGDRVPAFESGDSDELAEQVMLGDLPDSAGRDKARLLALARIDAPEPGRPMLTRGSALRSRFWAASPVQQA